MWRKGVGGFRLLTWVASGCYNFTQLWNTCLELSTPGCSDKLINTKGHLEFQ